MKILFLALTTTFFFAADVHAGTIVVVGKGVETAAPDTATVVLNASVNNANLSKAQAGNEAMNRKVIKDLTALGVSEKDISRSFANVTRGNNRTPKDLSYDVVNSLTVKIRDFSKLATILATAATDGATHYGQPEYTLSTQDALIGKARNSAYAEAKKEAELSANSMGLKIGKVVKVSVGEASIANLLAGDGSLMMGGGRASLGENSFDIEMQIEPVKTQYFVMIEYELIN
jgi:uncharacterized protein